MRLKPQSQHQLMLLPCQDPLQPSQVLVLVLVVPWLQAPPPTWPLLLLPQALLLVLVLLLLLLASLLLQLPELKPQMLVVRPWTVGCE